MTTHQRFLAAALAVSSLAGCLKFGDDVERVAPNVTAQDLAQVTALTGIQFPPGAQGLGYYYLGSGIDEWLLVKVAIPADQKAVFLENDIFTRSDARTTPADWSTSCSWCKVDSLTARTDRDLEIAPARFVQCAFGREGDAWVVYINWFET